MLINVEYKTLESDGVTGTSFIGERFIFYRVNPNEPLIYDHYGPDGVSVLFTPQELENFLPNECVSAFLERCRNNDTKEIEYVKSKLNERVFDMGKDGKKFDNTDYYVKKRLESIAYYESRQVQFLKINLVDNK